MFTNFTFALITTIFVHYCRNFKYSITKISPLYSYKLIFIILFPKARKFDQNCIHFQEITNMTENYFDYLCRNSSHLRI